MSPVAYSARNIDLIDPSREAIFFEKGRPPSEAALCAEMARLAYCRPAGRQYAFDQTRVNEALSKVGFAKGRFFEHAGTHCFLAVQEEAGKQLAVLAFRGTDSGNPKNLMDDADFIPKDWGKGGKVHSGFAHALDDVRNNTKLDDALNSITGHLLFTGHSLGAALATLMASVRRPAALYTFGSPKIGDAAFVATVSEVTNYRYVDCTDLITRVPLKIMGFEHVGKPHYIQSDRSVSFGPSEKFIARDRLRAAVKYSLGYAWRPGNVCFRELADHTPVNYVSAVTAAPDPSKQG